MATKFLLFPPSQAESNDSATLGGACGSALRREELKENPWLKKRFVLSFHKSLFKNRLCLSWPATAGCFLISAAPKSRPKPGKRPWSLKARSRTFRKPKRYFALKGSKWSLFWETLSKDESLDRRTQNKSDGWGRNRFSRGPAADRNRNRLSGFRGALGRAARIHVLF